MKNLIIAAFIALFTIAANAEIKQMKTKDGMTLQMDGDMYTVIDKDGKTMPANGDIWLEDGSKLTFKDGKKI